MNIVKWLPTPESENPSLYEIQWATTVAGPWADLAGSPVTHNLLNPAVFDGTHFFLEDASGTVDTVYRIRVQDTGLLFSEWSAPFWVGNPTTASVVVDESSRQVIGTEDRRAVDATAVVGRYEPLLTVDKLKSRFLFGIPLVAALPDPITRVRARYTDDELADNIVRAVGEVEILTGVHVSPMKMTVRLPFDRNEYRALGFFRVKDAPILSVIELKVTTADRSTVYSVPLQWIDPGQFQKGQVNLVPLQPAFIGLGGSLPSESAGGAAWLSILGQAGWVPSYWEMTYICGYNEGHIPVSLNELIGVTAAIEVLERLAATNRIGSYSLSLDAAGQSVNTGGPNIYDGPLQVLRERQARLVGKFKARHFKKFVIDNI